MQCNQNPSRGGILATLLTVSALCSLSMVQSKFLYERLAPKYSHKASENPSLLSDSNAVTSQRHSPSLKEILIGVNTTLNTTVSLTAVVYDLNWLNAQIVNATDEVINNARPRLQTSIRLDKDLYQPNDVVFAEVLMLNSQTKTPVALTAASIAGF